MIGSAKSTESNNRYQQGSSTMPKNNRIAIVSVATRNLIDSIATEQ